MKRKRVKFISRQNWTLLDVKGTKREMNKRQTQRKTEVKRQKRRERWAHTHHYHHNHHHHSINTHLLPKMKDRKPTLLTRRSPRCCGSWIQAPTDRRRPLPVFSGDTASDLLASYSWDLHNVSLATDSSPLPPPISLKVLSTCVHVPADTSHLHTHPPSLRQPSSLERTPGFPLRKRPESRFLVQIHLLDEVAEVTVRFAEMRARTKCF